MSAPMIQREAMFEPMLAADPSFQPRWTEFLADWCDGPDLPLYLALSSLAEHLLERLRDSNTEGFDRIFRKKKDPICNVCGKTLSTTKECAWTGCILNWDEDRADIISQNGNEGLHYSETNDK